MAGTYLAELKPGPERAKIAAALDVDITGKYVGGRRGVRSLSESKSEASGGVPIAALADIHCTRGAQGAYQGLFNSINDSADILVMCGDLTDYGLPEEAQVLAREIHSNLRVPVVAVLGNHDFEAGKQEEVASILSDAGVHMLDGDTCEIRGVGFAGIKGFAGGFGRYALGSWGEDTIKAFVHEAVEETLKLETALARLRVPRKVALLHYSPIVDTVVGEPPEIYAFLGSSRMAEPLLSYPVNYVFHGHAHNGTFHGTTQSGIPVYNVSMPLLQKLHPGKPPYFLVELQPSDA